MNFDPISPLGSRRVRYWSMLGSLGIHWGGCCKAANWPLNEVETIQARGIAVKRSKVAMKTHETTSPTPILRRRRFFATARAGRSERTAALGATGCVAGRSTTTALEMPDRSGRPALRDWLALLLALVMWP